MNRPAFSRLIAALTHRPGTTGVDGVLLGVAGESFDGSRAAGWTPRRRRGPHIRFRRPRIAGRVVMFLLMIPLLVGVAAPPAASGDDLSDARARQKALVAKIAQQKKQVARLQVLQKNLAADISSTANTLDGINANLTTTKKRVKRLSNQISQVRAVYLDLVRQVKDLDGQIVSLEAQQQLKEISLRDRKAMLTLRLQQAYQVDRTPVFQQLLSAGSIADVFEDVGSYLDFGVQDRDLAQKIQEDQEILATTHETLTDARTARKQLRAETLVQKKELDARMKDLKAAQARLAALQKETKTQLALQRSNWTKMSAAQKNLKRSIAANQAAENKLASHIKALINAQVNYGNIPSTYNGTLRWPMGGSLTQEFGCTGFGWEPPRGGCAHFHEGIDLAAPMYTAVRASAEGTVVFAGANPYDADPKAWIVIIAHSSSLQTWYAHLDNGSHPIPVRAGQHVTAGQVIGYEGMTGHTTGPHLHWAVRYNGSFVNPRLFT